jgi:hypothetical protein
MRRDEQECDNIYCQEQIFLIVPRRHGSSLTRIEYRKIKYIHTYKTKINTFFEPKKERIKEIEEIEEIEKVHFLYFKG